MTDTAKEYAAALYMLAAEEELTKTVSDGLKIVSAAMRETPEYLDFLSSPNIPVRERLSAVDKAFSGTVHEYVLSFLKLLCEKNHARLLHKCIADYEDMRHISDGIVTANVVSAVPLKKAEKEQLKIKLEKLTNKTVLLNCYVNRSILGGMIVHVDGKVFDGSLRRRLHDIKEVIK